MSIVFDKMFLNRCFTAKSTIILSLVLVSADTCYAMRRSMSDSALLSHIHLFDDEGDFVDVPHRLSCDNFDKDFVCESDALDCVGGFFLVPSGEALPHDSSLVGKSLSQHVFESRHNRSLESFASGLSDSFSTQATLGEISAGGCSCPESPQTCSTEPRVLFDSKSSQDDMLLGCPGTPSRKTDTVFSQFFGIESDPVFLWKKSFDGLRRKDSEEYARALESGRILIATDNWVLIRDDVEGRIRMTVEMFDQPIASGVLSSPKKMIYEEQTHLLLVPLKNSVDLVDPLLDQELASELGLLEVIIKVLLRDFGFVAKHNSGLYYKSVREFHQHLVSGARMIFEPVDTVRSWNNPSAQDKRATYLLRTLINDVLIYVYFLTRREGGCLSIADYLNPSSKGAMSSVSLELSVEKFVFSVMLDRVLRSATLFNVSEKREFLEHYKEYVVRHNSSIPRGISTHDFINECIKMPELKAAAFACLVGA